MQAVLRGRGSSGSQGEWFSLDVGGDEVDLLAALVRHDRVVSGSCICAQDDPVLRRGRVATASKAAPLPRRPLAPPRPAPLLTRNTRPAMVVPVLRA